MTRMKRSRSWAPKSATESLPTIVRPRSSRWGQCLDSWFKVGEIRVPLTSLHLSAFALFAFYEIRHGPMGSDQKYSSLDHSAPEVVELQDAPEVVSSAGLPLQRQSSLLQPESYEVRAHWKQEQDACGAYGTHSSDGDSQLPIYTSPSTPGHNGYMNGETGETQHSRDQRDERRCCGLRKRTFIWVVVGLVLLIGIAIILGAVLGTVLPDSG